MHEKFNPETDCPGCGQTLVISKSVRICPTEDSVQKNETINAGLLIARDEVIVLDGEKIQNPFGTQSRRIKTLFDRAHDVRFAQQKEHWYPEQRRDWAAA